MPIVASSGYRQASAILTLTRAALNDRKAQYFTDSVLLPYLGAAYRKLQKALANSGSETFITDEALLVVTAIAVDPSAQAAITDATADPNQLPVDLLVPLRLWERPNGTTQDFVDMVDYTGRGGLPSYPQGQTLGMWEWRADGLYFVGATVDTQIRLRYSKTLPDLTDGQSQISIRECTNTLSWFTAGYAAEARKPGTGTTLLQRAEDSLFDLQNASTRRDQRKGRRRRPFSRRRIN